MATFDPITYSAVNNLKEPVGSMLLVPENFTNPNYVNTGEHFNPVTYPELVASSVSVVDPVDVTSQTLPQLPNTASSSYLVTGAIWGVTQYLGDLYVFFEKGQVFRTTGGDLSSINYFRLLPTPPNGSYTVNTGSHRISFANDIVYMSFFISGTNKYLISMADLVSGSNVLTTVNAPFYNVYNKFVYGGGTTVAYVANTGASQNNVGQSTDGINFTTRVGAYTTSYTVTGAAYGAGIFVIVTSGTSTNNVATSPDGITWTARSVGTVGHQGVIWVPALNLFVAIANSATGSYYTSPDGITWTARTIGTSPSPTNIPTLVAASSSGTIVSISQRNVISNTALNNSQNMQVSTDGITWVNRGSSGPAQFNYNGAPINGWIAALGNTLVYLGMINTQTTVSTPAVFCYCTSTDGFATISAWSSLGAISNDASVRAPAFVNANVGIAFETTVTSTDIEYMGVKFNILRTTNGGATWTATTVSAAAPIRIKAVAASGGKFRIVGIYYSSNYTTLGGTIVGESTDGITWTWVNTSSVFREKYTIDTYDGTYYACNDQINTGTNLNLNISTDGVNWFTVGQISVSSGAALGYGRAGYRSGYLVGNGSPSSAVVYRSDIGTSYTMTLPSAFNFGTQGTATTIDLKLTANANKTVALVTGNANVFVSMDRGASWATYALPFTPTVNMSIALTDDWILITSTDSNGVWYSLNNSDWSFGTVASATYGIQASTSNGSKIYYGGITTAADDKIWTTNAATSYIPKVMSNVNGAKWVVKAKQT